MHVKKRPDTLNMQGPKNLESHQCDKCPKSFGSKNSLKNHINQVHIRDFNCNFCDETFPTNYQRNRHKESIHQESEKQKCNKCGKEFKSLFYLKNHLTKVHIERKFQCSICCKTFGFHSRLLIHFDSVHENSRKYRCNQCGKTFNSNGNLKNHNELVHQKKKKYACDFCEMSFVAYGTRKRHLQVAHQERTQKL